MKLLYNDEGNNRGYARYVSVVHCISLLFITRSIFVLSGMKVRMLDLRCLRQHVTYKESALSCLEATYLDCLSVVYIRRTCMYKICV